MKIGIIGGGSIGLMFAYYLSEQFEVTLYTRTYEQAKSIHQNGIHLISNGLTNQRSINAVPFKEWCGYEDLTILAVKQYHLLPIVTQMKLQQRAETDFIFLQNGMSHLKLLNELDATNIYVSTVEHGANKQNGHIVEHNGVGQTKLAIYKGEVILPHSFLAIPEFPILIEPDYYEMLINKLVVNAIINPLTAILKVRNGELIDNECYYIACKELFSEIKRILDLQDSDNYFKKVVSVCRQTTKNRSSMLKDIESNRPTEIDAIIGFILEEAERKQLAALRCQMLYTLVKGSER